MWLVADECAYDKRLLLSRQIVWRDSTNMYYSLFTLRRRAQNRLTRNMQRSADVAEPQPGGRTSAAVMHASPIASNAINNSSCRYRTECSTVLYRIMPTNGAKTIPTQAPDIPKNTRPTSIVLAATNAARKPPAAPKTAERISTELKDSLLVEFI